MRISSIYSNGMILQRDRENTVRGQFDEGETLCAEFDGISLEVVQDTVKMIWSVLLPAKKAGGPHTFTISSDKEKIEISDILFGDVYILGGQSNMELPLILTTDMHVDEIESADFADIRQFEVPKIPLFGEKWDILSGGKWVNADQKNIFGFSAIGFYFAKYKYLKDKIPVGLVQTAVGGAPVESLMSEENLLESMEKIYPVYKDTGSCNGDKSKCCLWCYKDMLKKYSDPEYVAATQKADMDREQGWYADLAKRDPGMQNHWENLWEESVETRSFHMPSTFYQTDLQDYKGSVWLQKVVDVPADFCQDKVELRLGTLIDGDDTYVNGVRVGGWGFKYPPRRYWLEKGLLTPGKNVITIRLIMNNNIGGAVIETPYCLKYKDAEISLEGEWKLRIGVSAEPYEGQTFFIWSPTALFNSMLYPIRGLNCKAMLFYQGESNCDYPQYYGELLTDMVREWRELFGQEAPFLMAEVTHWLGEGPVYDSDPFDGVREVQRKVVSDIPNAYLIKTYDLGWYNDLHPQNKKEVALRFLDIYEQENLG